MNLSEAVDYYLAIIGAEEAESFRKTQLIRAKFIWNEIRSNILRVPASYWVKVDKSKKPYRVNVPECIDKFYTAGALNKCNEFHPFVENNMMMIQDYVEAKCQCSEKDCLSIINRKEETIVFESTDYIQLNQTEYPKITTERVCGKDITITTETPYIHFKGQNTVQFELGMWVMNDSLLVYGDNRTGNDVLIHNNSLSDIHYFNGMYSNDGGSYWGNSGIQDMFRTQFRQSDVGVSNHSNFGINEINGQVANSPAAYTAWNNNLINFIKKQIESQGRKVYSISFAPNGITNGVNYTINRTLVTMEIDFIPDYILYNSNTSNEWNLANGTDYKGWNVSQISQTDYIHKFGIIHPFIIETEILYKTECITKCENLDIKECGCTAITENNAELIENNCSEVITQKCKEICNNSFKKPEQGFITDSDSGYFKFDIHNKIVFLDGDIPDQILLSGQTNGNTIEEEIIPEFCLQTFVFGMDYINGRYSQTLNDREKQKLQIDWNTSKTKLQIELPRNQFELQTWDNNTISLFYKW
jgi:hypothetical protein